MTKEQKDWIDAASYEQLLRRWRNAPVGDSIFQNEAGRYYEAALIRKRAEVGHDAAVRASKHIGWEGR